MKKIISALIVFALIFTMAITAFAAENAEVSPRGGTNACLVSSANPTDSFYMGSTVYANSTEIRVDLNRDSNYDGNARIVLSLYHVDGNRYYSLVFEANTVGVYRKTTGVTLPVGSYTVSIASTPCYIHQLAINFH